ncbi:unnamed protein product [Schistosoma mattheei]|uniref:Cadherin domain-containing protein n=1 Tax=Schistosoma mattheei TaxID=31246 RepID=A0AA85BNQ4_9TREM|nr:unnamed protein product [Schistosoma mattheei]
MIIHHYDYVIHSPLITLSLSKLYFYISFLFYFILCLSIHENTIQNISELTFTIKEELPIGTIIASNIQLGNLFLHFNHYGNIENMTNIIKILNQKDPGINCFHFQWLPLESLNDSNRNQLQLIINNRIDREILCPIKTHELRNNNNNNMNDPNHLDLDHINDLQSINSDCIITLRIALFINNLQKIYQIHIYIEDINDNPPKWNINNLTIYFHDEDPPGTKQSILLAYDIDIDINAKITYQLLNNDIYSYQLNDRNYNHYNNNNLNLRGTDIFELVQETLNHERLYLKTRYTLDRELKPYGWNLILLAINNDSLIQLSSQLLLHIHLIDINDNSPIFTQTLYKPQLPNQKIGIIPENYPINKTILKVSATDRDEGENAQLTYHLALDTTNNQLLCHFFNLTQNGELYLIQSLNVDRITQINSTRLYLPISMINLDVIVIDGAMIPYSKTGSTTIQLQIENIDDEPPEIYIHPIQSLKQQHHDQQQQQQEDDHSILHNHRFYETEIGVYENQTIGQLIALIEVKDPDDLMNPTSIQCRLIGSNSNDFYLSYHNSINNEYQLYTNTILDREIQSKLLVSIECKDLANHITLHNLIIHILDINDHQPQYDNEQEDQDDPDPDHGVNYRLDKTMKNRTWLTSNGLAYILATDNDIGINSQLIYELSNESIEHFNYKFTIHSNTGQLLAWGPFDRESISIYELSIIVKDNGYPIQLSTNCLVTINILDINDNIPIFHPQLNILGGYLFHIKENQLPGTYIGQIQAYDLDDLPPSIDITQLFHEYDQSNSLLVLSSSSSNIHNVNNDELKGILSSIDKKLTYSLKNEYHSQMFRIDPKTGVIITRTILDREIQGTYTFYAYVHDGPDKPIQITNTTVNKTEIQRTINNYRSHTASIMITITIQDENDNDPVFIRPNSTNHMILLNPTAIPGQSLSQLLAIDPDEGLNGQVSYAIKGETAGILFNVDPRTGLLYLESQIPRQYITNNKQKTTINNQGNDLNYPTFLLGLDACDHGEPRRCTHFPNLQIQIRSSSNIIDEGKSNEYRQTDLSINQQIDDIFMSQSSHGSLSSSSSSSSSYGSGTSTTYLGRYSLGEILIIGLSIFFSILILIILFIICIVRRRTQRILQNNERISKLLLLLSL